MSKKDEGVKEEKKPDQWRPPCDQPRSKLQKDMVERVRNGLDPLKHDDILSDNILDGTRRNALTSD